MTIFFKKMPFNNMSNKLKLYVNKNVYRSMYLSYEHFILIKKSPCIIYKVNYPALPVCSFIFS